MLCYVMNEATQLLFIFFCAFFIAAPTFRLSPSQLLYLSVRDSNVEALRNTHKVLPVLRAEWTPAPTF